MTKNKYNKNYFFFIFIFSSLSIFLLSLLLNSFFSLPGKDQSLSVTKADSTNKIILHYYIWSDEESYITPVINAYSALHTSIKINLHVIDSSSYDSVIKQLLSSDRKIDLLSIRGLSKMVQYTDEDKLLDLTDYIKNNVLDITAYGSMFNDIDVSGRYYGIPTRNTCWVLIFNKDIFNKAALSYPNQLTWDEYRQLAISLTKGEGQQKTFGGYWVPWCYNFAALVRSSYLIDDDLTFSRESLEMLNSFYNVDGSHMSYKELTDQEIDYRKEFEKGRIAMMPQGEWIVNMLLEDEKKGESDIDWDIAPLPIYKGQEKGTTWGQYQFVSISADTSYPEEAFRFVQFLCGEEGARIYAENGIIHAYSDESIKNLYLKTVGKESASIFFKVKKVQEEPAISGYEDLLGAFRLSAENYFLGTLSLDEAMTDFEAARKKILTETP